MHAARFEPSTSRLTRWFIWQTSAMSGHHQASTAICHVLSGLSSGLCSLGVGLCPDFRRPAALQMPIFCPDSQEAYKGIVRGPVMDFI